MLIEVFASKKGIPYNFNFFWICNDKELGAFQCLKDG